jgi:ATP-dependent protease HslVU (ClpYQ) ATPase subunit
MIHLQMQRLTPRQIASELDRYIIGQIDADDTAQQM